MSEEIPVALPSRIYLMGMMGVGKTTFGKQFAHQLGYAFMDLDRDIEDYEGRSIQQIFDLHGEAGFRLAERKALERTADHANIIIATGGGAPCFFDNIKWINEHGVSIYFRANAAFILSRIGPGKAKRPLLKGLNGPELEDFIAKMVALREPYYMQATHILTLPVKSLSGAVKSILYGNADEAV
jgi:shikimate kinase